eukprot:scaffold2911_cov414-Prasinococcus_capsulatus_cf.AAC.19
MALGYFGADPEELRNLWHARQVTVSTAFPAPPDTSAPKWFRAGAHQSVTTRDELCDGSAGHRLFKGVLELLLP